MLVISLLVAAGSAYAQTDKKATIKRIVEAKTYTFSPATASPINSTELNNILSRMPGATGGSNINITGGGYRVRVTPDSVIADLPYYGRVYRPSLNRDESGVHFTSTKFTYKQSINKKGIREINIKTSDNINGYWLNLSISPDGYASLMVSSNDKQSISYAGNIEENK